MFDSGIACRSSAVAVVPFKLEASCEHCLDSGFSPRFEGCSCERCGGRVRNLKEISAAKQAHVEKEAAAKKAQEVAKFWREVEDHFFGRS